MPATSFPEYARLISQIVNDMLAAGQAKLVDLQIDQRSIVRGFIRGTLLFDDDSELHFREFVDATKSEPRLMYAYHYQDATKALPDSCAESWRGERVAFALSLQSPPLLNSPAPILSVNDVPRSAILILPSFRSSSTVVSRS